MKKLVRRLFFVALVVVFLAAVVLTVVAERKGIPVISGMFSGAAQVYEKEVEFVNIERDLFSLKDQEIRAALAELEEAERAASQKQEVVDRLFEEKEAMQAEAASSTEALRESMRQSELNLVYDQHSL